MKGDLICGSHSQEAVIFIDLPFFIDHVIQERIKVVYVTAAQDFSP